MSNDWSNWLKRLGSSNGSRVAIVGIGQELRGDDAAGVLVARALKSALAHIRSVLVIEGGQAPENQTGVLRRFEPDLVLLVDAAEMGAASGEVRWLTQSQIDGLSASTHTLPLSMIAQFLSAELNCEVTLIGIQPAQIILGTALSPAVQKAVDDLARRLAGTLIRDA